MHRNLKELTETVEHCVKLSGGTLPLGIVARDEEERAALQKLLKGKRGAKLITPRLDPSVLSIKGIGKGSKHDDDDQHLIPAPTPVAAPPASEPTSRRRARPRVKADGK